MSEEFGRANLQDESDETGARSVSATDRFTEELRYCECWDGKTLHTDRPRDSDDGEIRCQWCGEKNPPLSSTDTGGSRQ